MPLQRSFLRYGSPLRFGSSRALGLQCPEIRKVVPSCGSVWVSPSAGQGGRAPCHLDAHSSTRNFPCVAVGLHGRPPELTCQRPSFPATLHVSVFLFYFGRGFLYSLLLPLC